jgi:hypothetical protein
MSRNTEKVFPVQLRPLAANDSCSVFQAAGAPSEQLVKDEVLGGREWDLTAPHINENRMADRLRLVLS